MTTTKCICVWQDEMDADGGWIVSIDEVDLGSNETDETATLAVYDTEEKAVEAAKLSGCSRGLPVYLAEFASDGYGKGNRHTLIQSVEAD